MPHHQHFGGGRFADHVVELIVEGKGDFMAPVPMEPCIGCVPHDCEDPCSAVSSMEPVNSPECPQTRLLNHILRVLIVTCEPTRQVVGRAELGRNNPFKESP